MIPLAVICAYVCTQHKRSERQRTQLAQPYLPTSRLIPSVCFFNAPPFTFLFIVRFAACSAAASVSPSASACYPCPSCSACCCCPAGPLPACLLRNCWKMASQFRLGLISTIALASLPSPPSLCLLSLFSFFEFAFWFSFCLQSREIKLFCPFSAFSYYSCCCHIGFYLSYCHDL